MPRRKRRENSRVEQITLEMEISLQKKNLTNKNITVIMKALMEKYEVRNNLGVRKNEKMGDEIVSLQTNVDFLHTKVDLLYHFEVFAVHKRVSKSTQHKQLSRHYIDKFKTLKHTYIYIYI